MGVWEELVAQVSRVEIYTQTAYDGYHIVVNSISSGEALVNLRSADVHATACRDTAVSILSGSHLVAFELMQPRTWMLVSICKTVPSTLSPGRMEEAWRFDAIHRLCARSSSA
jgi:hypothetical protein